MFCNEFEMNVTTINSSNGGCAPKVLEVRCHCYMGDTCTRLYGLANCSGHLADCLDFSRASSVTLGYQAGLEKLRVQKACFVGVY